MMESTTDGLNFCEITFAVPAQKFGISCSISTEEALPVVTEFALRVTHACGSVSRQQLQEFFGFSPMEIDAVIHTLVAERLLVWVEDSLELTPYAVARFIESSDNIPRFFKIKDYDVDLVFDLMSFKPKETRERANRVNTAMELMPKNLERESRTKVEAERSFQEHFHEIYKGGRAEIYKISDVDPGDRYYIPLACTFSIDVQDGIQVKRSLSDPTFDNRLEISSAISKVLSVSEGCENPDIAHFQSSFMDPFLGTHLAGDNLDFSRYVQDVHLRPTSKNSDVLIPIIGSLHLVQNRARIIAMLKDGEESDSDRAYWLAPQTRYWSRSRSVSSLTRGVTGYLRKSAPASDTTADHTLKSLLNVLFQAEPSFDREIANIYENTFPSLFTTVAAAFHGRAEILLIPGRLMCALYHYRVKNSPTTIPIGIISTQTDQLLAASGVFQTLCADGNIYLLDSKGARTLAGHKDFGFIPAMDSDNTAPRPPGANS